MSRSTIILLFKALVLFTVTLTIVIGCGNKSETKKIKSDVKKDHSREMTSDNKTNHSDSTHTPHTRDENHGHEKEYKAGGNTLHTPHGKMRNKVRVINVTAQRYEFKPSPIVVNKGEKIRLKVKSKDVTHGIGIKDFDISKKLPPGETVEVQFNAVKAGTFHIHCSVYCGPGHENMHGKLIVLENE